ncbi:MAG: HAD family hydrolase, partial [Bdellovibrionales bacterium]|nr:HAD family hydrolase [Bdellovibrionales bacterium]
SPEILGRSINLSEAQKAYAANSIGSLAQGCDPLEVEAKFWSSWSRDTCYPQTTFSWTHAVLDSLKSRGLLLALATSRIEPFEEVQKYLQEKELTGYFDTILTLHGRGHRWDEKDLMVNDILKRCQLSPNKAVLVGDHPEDMKAGVRSNVQYNIGVLTGGFSEATLSEAGAHTVVASGESLLDLM